MKRAVVLASCFVFCVGCKKSEEPTKETTEPAASANIEATADQPTTAAPQEGDKPTADQPAAKKGVAAGDTKVGDDGVSAGSTKITKSGVQAGAAGVKTKGDKNEISAGGVKIKTDKKSGKQKVNVGGVGVGY